MDNYIELDVDTQIYQPGVMVLNFNHSTWEAEACGDLNSKLAWSTQWVPYQSEILSETLSQKKKELFLNKGVSSNFKLLT